MPFDGSGNFTRVMNWVADAAANVKIRADRHDQEDNNFASGLSNVLTKDGQTQPTADIPLNAKKIVNLGAPTNPTDATTKGYVDGIRTFSSPIVISGSHPNSQLKFTGTTGPWGDSYVTADLAAGARGTSWVWNDKADFSGTDVMTLTTSGYLTLKSLAGSAVLVLDRAAAGAADIHGKKANLLRWLLRLGDTSAESTGDLGSNFGLYRYNDAGTVASTVMTASRATGLVTFPNPVAVTGNLSATTFTATGGYFIGHATAAVLGLASGGSGNVYLRPNGYDVTTNQTYISPTGDMNVAGSVTAASSVFSSQTFGSTGTHAIVSTANAAGSVYLRSGGSTGGLGQGGQLLLGSTGILYLYANGGPGINLMRNDTTTGVAGQNIAAINSYGYSNTGTQRAYAQIAFDSIVVTNGAEQGRIRFITMAAGVVSTTLSVNDNDVQVTGALSASGSITSSGNVTAAGAVYSGQSFISSTTAVILAPTGAGNIYLRPNGSGSVTGQVTLTAGGAATVNGTLAVTSGIDAAYVINGEAGFTSAGGYAINKYGVTITTGSISMSSPGTTAHNKVMFYNGSPALVGYIQTSGTATSYGTSSDENLKELDGEMDPAEAIAIIRADPVLAFRWKSSGEQAIGWFAQKSHAINENLAMAPPAPAEDEVAAKPGEEGYMPWGIDYGRRTPYLWAALTDVLDRLEALEAKLSITDPKPTKRKAA